MKEQSKKKTKYIVIFIFTHFLAIMTGYIMGQASQIDPSMYESANKPSQDSQQPSEQPQEQVQPVNINLSGNAQTSTEKFALREGLATIKLTHSGSANFIVYLMDDQGNKAPSLVNEIGSFDGSTSVRIEKAGNYLLDIKADGAWTVNITQ